MDACCAAARPARFSATRASTRGDAGRGVRTGPVDARSATVDAKAFASTAALPARFARLQSPAPTATGHGLTPSAGLVVRGGPFAIAFRSWRSSARSSANGTDGFGADHRRTRGGGAPGHDAGENVTFAAARRRAVHLLCGAARGTRRAVRSSIGAEHAAHSDLTGRTTFWRGRSSLRIVNMNAARAIRRCAGRSRRGSLRPVADQFRVNGVIAALNRYSTTGTRRRVDGAEPHLTTPDSSHRRIRTRHDGLRVTITAQPRVVSSWARRGRSLHVIEGMVSSIPRSPESHDIAEHRSRESTDAGTTWPTAGRPHRRNAGPARAIIRGADRGSHLPNRRSARRSIAVRGQRHRRIRASDTASGSHQTTSRSHRRHRTPSREGVLSMMPAAGVRRPGGSIADHAAEDDRINENEYWPADDPAVRRKSGDRAERGRHRGGSALPR